MDEHNKMVMIGSKSHLFRPFVLVRPESTEHRTASFVATATAVTATAAAVALALAEPPTVVAAAVVLPGRATRRRGATLGVEVREVVVEGGEVVVEAGRVTCGRP